MLIGKPNTLSREESNKIPDTLNNIKYKGLKKTLTRRGQVTLKLSLIERLNLAKYTSNI